MSAPFSPRSTFYISDMPVTKFEYCAVCGSFYPRFFMIFCRMSYSLWYSLLTTRILLLISEGCVRMPPLDTSVSYFCRCNDHSKIIKEVESILFSLSLILAIASKVFSLAGLTRFIILAPDPYSKKKNFTVELINP